MNVQLLWTLITAVGVAGALLIGLGMKKLNRRLRELDPAFQSPLLCFRYTAHEAAAYADTLKQKGALALVRRFDGMMLAMMAEVLLLLLAATHNITEMVWLQWIMFSMSGAVWLAGSLEALVLSKAPRLSAALSLLKWGAFAVWTLGMFVGLFIRAAAY